MLTYMVVSHSNRKSIMKMILCMALSLLRLSNLQ
nr:MAG TPA: hypothetical protein [Caudoviricetes sp.]DAK80260.1 MAG TPA: hypothetical protein [Caudoviricetes sp.]